MNRGAVPPSHVLELGCDPLIDRLVMPPLPDIPLPIVFFLFFLKVSRRFDVQIGKKGFRVKANLMLTGFGLSRSGGCTEAASDDCPQKRKALEDKRRTVSGLHSL